MKTQGINWSFLAILAGITLFLVSVCLILSQSGIFQEILSFLVLISTGRALF